MRTRQNMRILLGILFLLFVSYSIAVGAEKNFRSYIYEQGALKPIDSILKITVGAPAPDFILPSVKGSDVTLSQFRGQKNVVLSFIPAAWTPVCSDQWPGYIIAQDFFTKHNAVLLGVTVDNIPTLYAWTSHMGDLWFDVLSDFWPHGQVAQSYGLLRSDGTAERALVFINREGLVSGVHVSDINVRPPLELIVSELEKMD